MDYKKILVFRTGHLGDTLVSLPAFWAIKKSLPGASMTLLSNTNPQNPQYVLAKSILPDKGLFDDWLSYPTGIGLHQAVKLFGKLCLEVRKRKFDALFYLMNRSRSLRQIRRDEIFFRLAGIKKIFGTGYLKQNILDFNQPKPLPRVISEGDFLLKSLEFEKFQIPPINKIKPKLLLTEKENKFARCWLEKNVGRNFKEKLKVGIAPASKWDSKVWAEKKYFRIVKQLIKEKGIFPIVLGGLEDKEKGDRLIKMWGKGANAAGNLNVRQAAAVLKHCKFYLGNDTGTMHLAATVGTTCICIFSAIDYEGRWYPRGNQHIIFRERVECEGCHTPDCFNKNKCLELIEEREVLEACLKALKNV